MVSFIHLIDTFKSEWAIELPCLYIHRADKRQIQDGFRIVYLRDVMNTWKSSANTLGSNWTFLRS